MESRRPLPFARRSHVARRKSRGRAGRGIGTLVVSALMIGLLLITAMMASAVTVGAATAATFYHHFTRELPSIGDMSQRETFKTTSILDRNGDLLYEIVDQTGGKRSPVRLSDLHPQLIQAVLAAEDASFYDNPGIEPRGILRAAYQDLTTGRIVSGASTITMQLVRNVLMSEEERTSDTLDRKMREAFLAMEVSANFSKDQILEWYLNEIYYGNISYGIGTAAKTYFNKAPKDLDLAESALLAGLPQAPARYDPFLNFDAAKRRQTEVLELMVRNNFITAEQAEDAEEEDLNFVEPETTVATIRYPHWVFYVRSVLEEMYGAKGLSTAGLKVYTTIDPTLQDLAENAVRTHVAALARQDANDASLVAIDPTNGEILAMVGSPDYYSTTMNGQVNAALTLRQPGSAIKPVVYLEAFIKGFSPATVVQDEPIALPDGTGRMWRPQNYDNKFRGPVTLRRALGNSLNIPAVKVLQYAGLEDTMALARRMGIVSLGDASNYGLSFVLGGAEVRLLELATAYTVLANNGDKVPVSPILKIVDSNGRTVFEHATTRENLVDPRLAFQITDMLSDNNARMETFGPNSPLRLAGDRPAAAKTGSTDDYRDSWTMGYTPSLVTGVWVGRDDDRPMRLVMGSSGAGLIWKTFMEGALANWPMEEFPIPPGIIRSSGCRPDDPRYPTPVPTTTRSGPRPAGPCGPSAGEWVLEERTPANQAKVAARSVALDRTTNKLADHDTPYNDVIFRTFRAPASGEGPFAPSDYSERVGVTRPWEVMPPTILPTLVPATPTPTEVTGPTATPNPNWTPAPTSTMGPTATPTSSVVLPPTRTPPPVPTARPTFTPTAAPEEEESRPPEAPLANGRPAL
jgi:1A family penicillin-binding protein